MDSPDRPSAGGDADEAYPPSEHVLRDLGLDVEVMEGGITKGLLGPRAGAPAAGAKHDVVPFGVVATAVDVLAGALCARTITPDWMATSVMSMQLGEIHTHDVVELSAQVLRAGRSAVTVEVRLARMPAGAANAEPVGVAVLTFARLARRESTLVLPDAGGSPGDRYGFGRVDRGSGRIGPGIDGFDRAIGCELVDGPTGRTRTDISGYVRNSFGAVNGGVVAAVAESAARAACRDGRAASTDPRVSSLTSSFLGQGRVGPVVTSAEVVLADGPTRTVRVEVADDGQTDPAGEPRLMMVAHVVVGPGMQG